MSAELTGLSKVLSAVFQTFKGTAGAAKWLADKNSEHDPFGLYGERYINHLRERYSTIRMFAMPEAVPLTNIYTRVNILKKITSRQKATIEEMEQYFDWDRRVSSKEKDIREGLEIVNELTKIILLGKPGAGKTTFLKYIILQSANGNLKEDKIPIFITLKQLSDSDKSLIDFITQQFDICRFPDAKPFIEHALDIGKCIVLLDGLDEVDKAKESKIINEIQNLTDKYPVNQYILTCRIAAYTYCFEKFREVEMADFNEAQIKIFINSWFGSNAEKAKKCWEEIKDNRPLIELASIPLLLTMLCLVFDETMSFPKNRAELYEEAINALLKKWDSSRNIKRQEIYKNLSLKRKENLLNHIAYSTYEQGKYYLPKRTLEQKISDFIRNVPGIKEEELDVDSEAILESIEAHHGLFIERAREIYSFSHLTFQEYFAAKYFVDNAKKGTLERLVNNHILNHRWREVFLLVTGLLAEADDFLLSIKVQCNSFINENTARILFEAFSNKKLENAIISNKYLKEFAKDPLLFRVIKVYNFLDIAHTSANTTNLRHNLAVNRAYTRAIVRVLNPDLHNALEIPREFGLNLKRDFIYDIGSEIDPQFIEFLFSTYRLVECVNTDCYISKETRQKILDELLTIPVKYQNPQINQG